MVKVQLEDAVYLLLIYLFFFCQCQPLLLVKLSHITKKCALYFWFRAVGKVVLKFLSKAAVHRYKNSHGRCSIKKLFLKISQYSQKNTSKHVLKSDSNAGVSLEILRNL